MDVLKLISDEKCEPNFDLNQLSTKTEYNCVPFSNIAEEILSSKQEEDNALKELLRQEDLRKDTSKRSLKKSIKKLKNSSQNLFKKSRSKRYDASNDDDLTDKSSLNSYSSDISAKFSFSEIKNEFKRKSHFRSLLSKKTVNEGDGSGMAALLVRSVMHAHSSLDCIKESLESNSPSSTLRRSSKSQPKIEITTMNKIVSPEISIDITPDISPIEVECVENPLKLQFLSLDNISLNSDKPSGNLNSKIKKRSVESCPATPKESMIVDPYLSIPSSQNIMGSSMSSTICSSDEYSSSDEIDDSDEISDGNKNINTNSADTVSLVVRSVVGHQIDSNIISHMDEKLDNISPKSTEKPYFEFENDLWNSDCNSEYNDLKQYMNDNKDIHIDHSKDPSLFDNNEIKKNTLTTDRNVHHELVSDSDISQNYSESPNSFKKVIDPDLDLPPVMGGAGIKSPNLVDTALQTMLLDKANIIGCYSSPPTAGISSPTSAEPDKHKFKFHFPRHLFRRHKSEIDEDSLKNKVFRKASKISLPSLGPIRRKFRTFSDGDKKKEEPTLIKTAIQTILMEKVNIMGEIIAHNPIVGDEEHLHPVENEEEHYRRHSHSFHAGDGEDRFDIHSDVLSCYSDDSKQNTLDVPYDTLSHDLLSLSMKETVLGSPFLSYNELRCFSHPNINLIDGPKFNVSRRFSDISVENEKHSSDSKIEQQYGMNARPARSIDKYLSDKRGSIDSNLYQKKSKNSIIKRKISSVKETSQSVENLQPENRSNDPCESFLITNNLIENLNTDVYCEASKISEELTKEVSKSKPDCSDIGNARPKVVHERSSYSKPDGNKHAPLCFSMHRSLFTFPQFVRAFSNSPSCRIYFAFTKPSPVSSII